MALFSLLGSVLLVLISLIATLVTAKREYINQQKLKEKRSKPAPTSRDGVLVSALAIELVTRNGKEIRNAPWLSELYKELNQLVPQYEIKPAGIFQSIYMAASTEDRMAHEGLVRMARCAVEIRELIQDFALEHNLDLVPKFGIHCDIVPMVGIGCSAALSHLWSVSLSLSDEAMPNEIHMSTQSLEWIGGEFDLTLLPAHPILSGF
ncbi:MAG: hypothetical protein NTU72_03100 [Fimbriimonadales bacterium]|jgi:hypothetical protein|nr:hypothetical protein [Fimbriimonadales bacterium]